MGCGSSLTEVEAAVTDVRALLAELHAELVLLKQLPEIAARVREIHPAVTALAAS
jgi:hypothetical protein